MRSPSCERPASTSLAQPDSGSERDPTPLHSNKTRRFLGGHIWLESGGTCLRKDQSSDRIRERLSSLLLPTNMETLNGLVMRFLVRQCPPLFRPDLRPLSWLPGPVEPTTRASLVMESSAERSTRMCPRWMMEGGHLATCVLVEGCTDNIAMMAWKKTRFPQFYPGHAA